MARFTPPCSPIRITTITPISTPRAINSKSIRGTSRKPGPCRPPSCPMGWSMFSPIKSYATCSPIYALENDLGNPRSSEDLRVYLLPYGFRDNSYPVQSKYIPRLDRLDPERISMQIADIIAEVDAECRRR